MSKKEKQTTAYGICKYCGQRIIVFLPEGKTVDDYEPKELNDMATGRCGCDEAMKEAVRTVQEADALAQIDETFAQMLKEEPGMSLRIAAQQSIVKDAVKFVCRGMIESAQIRMDAHSSFAIGLKSNGNLRIRRTFKGTEEWIF